MSRIVSIVPHSFFIYSHCFFHSLYLDYVCVVFDRRLFFWCFAAAMLTFFGAWPAFHIRAGQGVLFAFTIMGDPQLLFRTLEEPLKWPCRRGMLCCTAKSQASREVS